jgi:hypothetical protein
MKLQTGLRLFLLAVAFPTLAFAQTPTPEMPNPNFGDIAAVFPNPSSPTGAVIVYNPVICAQIGAFACGFFRVHEHGHVALKHQFQPGIHPVARERDADRFAAFNAQPQQILAAWNLFRLGGSSSNWHTYGTPVQRAIRLCNFAKQSGRWIGPANAC